MSRGERVLDKTLCYTHNVGMTNTKYRANLMLNEDVYKRSKAACEALDTTISAYVDDYLKLTLPILEVAAESQDFRAVGSAFGVQLSEKMSEVLHTNKGGDGSKKAKKRISKK